MPIFDRGRDLPMKSIRGVEGIKIHLYRRPIAVHDDPPTRASDFMVWGYFDWVSLRQGKFTLKDFFNGAEREQDETKAHYEEQFLCAYSDSELVDINDINKPLLVITEIKLNEQALLMLLNQTPSPLIKAKELIAACLKKSLPSQNDVEYQILYSLGYSDLLIIFRASSYQPIQNALFDMRNFELEDGCSLVKSTYSIQGIHKSFINGWTDQTCRRTSIFMSLKPGTSLTSLRDEMAKNLSISSEEIHVYSLFGKYDVEVIIENYEPIKDIVGLFYEGNQKKPLLSPSSEFFHKYINYTRTRWLYPPIEIDIPIAPLNQSSIQIKHNGIVIDQFPGLWAAYDFIIKEVIRNTPNMSFSLLLGLQDLLKYYWQVVNNDIVDQLLQNEIGTILTSLLGIIICDMGVDINSVEDAFKKASFVGLTTKRNFEENSFEMAVDLLAELLQNLVQATRMILEAPIYNIRFINSSTKIYICYYTIVELIERALETYIDREHGHPIPNFFTMIHHSDQIKSHLLFPDAKTFHSLVSIRLDRDSFFSPLRCLPIIAHEIGHYASPDVPLRNNKLLSNVLYDIARQLVLGVVIGSENSYLFQKIQEEEEWKSNIIGITNRIKERLQMEFKKGIEENRIRIDINDPNFRRFCLKLVDNFKEIFGFIDHNISIASIELNRNFCIYFERHLELAKRKEEIDHLIRWLNETIKKGEDETPANEFFDVEANYLSDGKDLNKSWKDLINKYQIRKREIEILAGDISEIILSSLTNEATAKSSFINALIKNVSCEERKHIAYYFADRRINEYTDQNLKALNERVITTLQQIDYQKLIELYFSYFEETTADLFMICALGLSPDAYFTILDAGHIANLSENNIDPWGDYAKDGGLNTKVQAQIIFENWSSLVGPIVDLSKIKQTIPSDEINRVKSGIFSSDLIDYLREIAGLLKTFCLQPEIQELRDYYQRLLDDGTAQSGTTPEIKFIEAYWEKRLLMSNWERGMNNDSGIADQ